MEVPAKTAVPGVSGLQGLMAVHKHQVLAGVWMATLSLPRACLSLVTAVLLDDHWY